MPNVQVGPSIETSWGRRFHADRTESGNLSLREDGTSRIVNVIGDSTFPGATLYVDGQHFWYPYQMLELLAMELLTLAAKGKAINERPGNTNRSYPVPVEPPPVSHPITGSDREPWNRPDYDDVTDGDYIDGGPEDF